MEYKIIHIFYIVRTNDSRGEEMDSSSPEESSESSLEETSSNMDVGNDEDSGWSPIEWII